jgi:hypothetical protein
MTSTAIAAAIVSSTLIAAILAGKWLRRKLPADHLRDETRETVKVTVGLVATMSAMVLGLLVSSAKESFDISRTHVIQMGAKVTLLDRVLTLYGPDAAEARTAVSAALEDSMQRIWPASADQAAELSIKPAVGNTAYAHVLRLSPGDDVPRQVLKDQAVTLMTQLGEMRTLLEAQSSSALSKPLLAVMVCWLALIFLGFTLLAPANLTATASLFIALLSCCAAIVLILELNRPFSGHLRVSSEPLQRALDLMKQTKP